jgi:hypothetical protein
MRKYSNGLRTIFLSVVSALAIGFCLCGVVEDYTNFPSSIGRPSNGISEKATIVYGWPLVFGQRKVEYRQLTFPSSFETYPPMLNWKSWAFWEGAVESRISIGALIFDCVVGLLVIGACWTCYGTLVHVVRSKQIRIIHCLYFFFASSLFLSFIATGWHSYRIKRKVETAWNEAGAKLYQPTETNFFIRLLGRNNVPSFAMEFRHLDARVLDTSTFRELAQLKNSWIETLDSPEQTIVDEDFMQLVSNNFSLSDLYLSSPVLKSDDLTPLNTIDRIYIFDASQEVVERFELEVSTDFFFTGIRRK